MSEFKFVDQPPPAIDGRGKGDKTLIRFAAVLRDNPGRWAVYPKPVKSAHTVASNIKRGAPVAAMAFHGGGFEAISRKGVVYVRYVGDSQAAQ